MMSEELPCRVQQHVSIQRIGEETLVYDELRHKAFCLNRSSSAIWRLADGARTVAEIRAAVSQELGVEVNEDLVQYALAELRSDGLIEPASAAEVTVSRRALLRTLGVSGALLLPMIVAVMAPPAAQAYNGCVDCSAVPARRRGPGSVP